VYFRRAVPGAAQVDVRVAVDWRILWEWALSAWVVVPCYSIGHRKVTNPFRNFCFGAAMSSSP
jgi:hypothetical protein